MFRSRVAKPCVSLRVRILRLEGLEDRRLLAAFDLGDYERINNVQQLATSIVDRDWSGVAYYQDSAGDEFIFAISNDVERIEKYALDGSGADGSNSLQQVALVNFDDTEGITWMGGDHFAVIEEGSGDISIFTITSSTTSIDKMSLASSDVIELTGTDSQNLPDNDHGLEGLTFVDGDPETTSDDIFYIVKEETTGSGATEGKMGVYKVERSNGNTTEFLTDFSGVPAGVDIEDLADIHYANGSLFLLSEKGDEEVVRYDIADEAFDSGVFTDVQGDAEGLSLRPDGFEMFVVADNNPPDYRRHRLVDDIADFDGDGGLDADDIDLLYDEVFGRMNPPNNYDLTNDGTVDQVDVDFLVLTMLGTYYGDHDLDGDVDIDDLNTVRNNFGMPNAGWADGDFDGDETVDIDDLNTVRNNFGAGGESAMMGRPTGDEALTQYFIVEYAGRADDFAAYIAPLVAAETDQYDGSGTTTTLVDAAATTSVDDDLWFEILESIQSSVTV